jgi:hypothetical protein
VVRLGRRRGPQQLLRLMTILLIGAWSRNEVMYRVYNRGSLCSVQISLVLLIYGKGVGVGRGRFVRLGRSEACELGKSAGASRVRAER